MKIVFLIIFLANLGFSSETIYLISGDEIEGVVSKLYEKKFDFISSKKQTLPYDHIAAVKINGVLSNGPFNLIVMGQLFPALVADSDSKNKMDSPARDSILDAKPRLC